MSIVTTAASFETHAGPPGIARGGKALYGAPIGILMLEARFPRIPGELGNALSFPFPVLYKVVADASPARVVHGRAEGLVDAFVAGGRELVALGAEAITTNCGFLVLHQEVLQRALPVPVATSPLLQGPMIQAILPPGKRVGIVTISAPDLGPEHLAACGLPQDTPVVGTPRQGAFAGSILDNRLELDVGAAREELLDAGARLLAAHPEVGAILLECTNMPPYAGALRARFGLPVFDALGLVFWLQQGLAPRAFV